MNHIFINTATSEKKEAGFAGIGYEKFTQRKST